MGESKRRCLENAALELTKNLIDEGKLIEAGFVAFARYVISPDASPIHFSAIQLAFMAGAEHVWSSVLAILGETKEPNDAEMRRMEMIQHELDEWRAILLGRGHPPKGSA